MSGIESPRIHATTYQTHDGICAVMSLDKAVAGCGLAFRMVNTGDHGAFYLCLRKDNPRDAYIVAVPSAKWKDDIRSDGFTIVQRINFDQLIATADHHEKQESGAWESMTPKERVSNLLGAAEAARIFSDQ